MTDMVWHSGGTQAETFHRIADDGRRTVCGRTFGRIVKDQAVKGHVMPQEDATAAGKTECRTCFGHAQTRKPIMGSRRNDP